MPKATRRRTVDHEKSVPVSAAKRKFAADQVIERVSIGGEADKSAQDILTGSAADGEREKSSTKKEKKALRHELFVQRLESSKSPYSKSHERRLKRKAKEAVAGGLDEIQVALNAVSGDFDPKEEGMDGSRADAKSTAAFDDQRPKVAKPGTIGEGHKVPLSKAQRKRALKTERLRAPLILANPEFTNNPFKTIRTHAQNTLVVHHPPQKIQDLD